LFRCWRRRKTILASSITLRSGCVGSSKAAADDDDTGDTVTVSVVMFGKFARHGKYRFLFFVSLLVGEGSFGLQKAKVYYCLHSLLSLLVRHRTLGFIYL
jgi:hypothetical protein